MHKSSTVGTAESWPVPDLSDGRVPEPVAGVELRGLLKKFRVGRRSALAAFRHRPDFRAEVTAVDNLNLRAERGEVLVVLGPNGAGKTTTLKIISTLLRPTSGEVLICGIDALTDPARARLRLGVVMGGDRSVYWKLTARENLRYYAVLQQIARGEARSRVEAVLAEVGLSDRGDDYVERFSTGMRQRLVLARALLAEPDVVLLDEPTSGLDAHAAAYLRGLVAGMRERGTTVILATHNMDEAEELADRVAVIDHGSLIALDGVAALKLRTRCHRRIVAEFLITRPEQAQALVSALSLEMRVVDSEVTGEVLRAVIHSDHADRLPRLYDAARREGVLMVRADTQDPTLSDVFFDMTGTGPRE
jgi:ABC-2 type transport system ATP-binding protein